MCLWFRSTSKSSGDWRGERKRNKFEGKIAQHKYTLNGVTAVEHVEIERRKKGLSHKSLYHS